MLRRLTSIVCFALLTSCVTAAPPSAKGRGATVSPSAPEFGDAFWKHWGDGKAELAAYDLETPRYGVVRSGTAIAIFVTETFSNTLRVKADPGKHPKSDEFPVMKLNLVEDFATGIYDYNIMTSAFVALTPMNGRSAGAVTKVSFSAQEWCGHVYSQILLDAASMRFTGHSYFDGEADHAAVVPIVAETVSEDALMVWARGLAYPLVKSGDSVSVPLARSLREARFLHRDEGVARAMFTRAMKPESVTVPAGTFECEVSSVRIEGGSTWTYFTERTAPYRIVRWTSSEGEKADLLGCERLPYWQLTAPGGESALARLGLKPRSPRMP